MSLGDLFDKCGDAVGTVVDWHMERPWYVSVPVIVFEWIALFAVFAVPYIMFDTAHPCIAFSAPVYHAPTYVMSGKVLVPVGGGTYADCEKRQ